LDISVLLLGYGKYPCLISDMMTTPVLCFEGQVEIVAIDEALENI